MRHGKKGFKLGRTHSHRKATMAALSNALIAHKRITTTVTKAKALRTYVEPLISRAKEDTTHNRRQVFRYLQDKNSVKELFGDIADQVGDRPGGYTRVIKLGQRAGDGAEMAMIELVDYNDVKPEGSSSGGSSRRTRRGGGKGRRRRKKSSQEQGAVASAVATAQETAEDVAEQVEEVAEAAADTAQEAVEAATDAVEDAVEAASEAAEDVADAVTGEDDEEKKDNA